MRGSSVQQSLTAWWLILISNSKQHQGSEDPPLLLEKWLQWNIIQEQVLEMWLQTSAQSARARGKTRRCIVFIEKFIKGQDLCISAAAAGLGTSSTERWTELLRSTLKPHNKFALRRHNVHLYSMCHHLVCFNTSIWGKNILQNRTYGLLDLYASGKGFPTPTRLTYCYILSYW